MTEPKRVTFTTLSSSVSASVALGAGGGGASTIAGGGSNVSSTSVTSLRFGTDFLADQPTAPAEGRSTSVVGNKSGNKTLRLSMELFPTDSCSYPEFNFSKLLHLEKKKIKKLKQKSNGFADPFNNENDDDVTRIAKELEKKYGSAYGSGRGRSKKDDHCDIGLGYDESDSFIDNTEAYDEVIPEEVETLEGGFYINCGALEFKKLHTESVKTRTDEIIKMPNRARKRVLSSSSSSGDSSSSDDDDDDEEVDSEGEASSVDAAATKAAKNSNNAVVPPFEKRPKTSTGNMTASANAGVGAAVVAKKSQSQTQDHDNGNSSNCSQKKRNNKSLGIGGSSSSNSPKPPSSVGSDSDKERVRQKTVKTTTVKDMLKAKRDNFLKMQEGGVSGVTGSSGSDAKTMNGELKGAASKSSDEESTSSDDSGEPSDSDRSVPQGKKPKKPANPESTNEKLRSVDTKLPEMDAEIIASLSNFKDLVTVKNMTGKRFQFDGVLTEVFLKIDDSLLCIDKAKRNMVFAHLEYQLLLPKYYLLRKAKELRMREEKQKSKRALGKLRKAIIEAMPGAIANFEVELRKHAELQSANINADHPPKMPKKKFPWNNNLRNLLYEVYQVRWTSYPVLGTRKETLEDFISVYMREKVVELWPSGWMRYEELQREIEKRKSAAKKAKDKKKAKDTVSSAGSAQTSSSTNLAPLQANTPVNVPPLPATNSFLKQFEDFATGSRSSCANSDTESVASSSASNGLKRKTADANKEAGARSKTLRATISAAAGGVDQLDVLRSDNGGGSKKQPLSSTSSATTVELLSTGKKLEHSIPNVLNVGVAANGQQLPSQSAGLTTPQSQPKHSKPSDPNICVIDLDKYRSPNDILQTSQQMLKTDPISTLGASASTSSNTNAVRRRESSSESDGVEIVGIYTAKSLPLPGVSKPKHKKNANNTLPALSTSYHHMDPATATLYTAAPTIINTNNNNNNNNTNANHNNSKKLQSGINSKVKDAASSSSSSTLEFDPLQVARALKELGDLKQLQQQSNLLPPNASKKDPNAQ